MDSVLYSKDAEAKRINDAWTPKSAFKDSELYKKIKDKKSEQNKYKDKASISPPSTRLR